MWRRRGRAQESFAIEAGLVQSFGEKLDYAGAGGGLPGIGAQAAQVSALMWLHTILNYQYRNGTTLGGSISALWREGGIRRLYRGFGFALVLSPSTRFLDTAANAGALSLLDSYPATENYPLAVKTACGSVVASMARLTLLPLDVMKTMAQVEGPAAMTVLRAKLQAGGPGVMFHGAGAAVTSSCISHFPWFFTYNTLDANLPEVQGVAPKVLRSAGIGFSAATAAAISSNWVRVIKTCKQTSVDPNLSYSEIVSSVVRKGGIAGLMGRGLPTKIMINGVQSAVFTVLWKLGQELQHQNTAGKV